MPTIQYSARSALLVQSVLARGMTEWIPTVKMETRHSTEGSFSSEFPAICKHCGVTAAQSQKCQNAPYSESSIRLKPSSELNNVVRATNTVMINSCQTYVYLVWIKPRPTSTLYGFMAHGSNVFLHKTSAFRKSSSAKMQVSNESM